MPPTRRNQPKTPPALASSFLTRQFWEMKKRLQNNVAADVADDCPVCLESVLNCRHCFCLLACGHALHTACFLQLRDDSCPVCRAITT